MRALLALEDGTWFAGESFGAEAEQVGEVVFNTSMTGYQEVLTDPSYRGQMVTMTYPHIGNTGINEEDVESDRPQVEGFIVRELSPVASNWRSRRTLHDYLAAYGIPGISGVDTRALTLRLRTVGVLKGALSTLPDADPENLIEKARAWEGLEGRDLVWDASCREPYQWADGVATGWRFPTERPASPFHVLAYDFGLKRGILRRLADHGCRVTIVPAYTPAAEALALAPDGIFLSNGPGDPAGLPYAAEATRAFLDTGLPLFGICLGHQILGLALGGRTYKLKFGHHGSNHPVREVATGQVQITAQNHNYAVDAETLDPNQVEITHWNLNDNTVEGMRLCDRPVFSVQYHPEASPGPHDADKLFADFVRLMQEKR
ncbi:MAG: glutamine-hydrolyzing carbamoyl-phosphate synthase small subunit [Anaerolineae bacterium]|nr:glutamine-hydrolyzing carbamoyl-phosphate synthase small subunit [Anaerolineae bacterium]